MNLDYVFTPKSIAIIGASTKEGSVGNDVVKNLVQQGYKGEIYPVNPKADELYGLKCYPSISDVPTEVEMAIFAIPAQFVPTVITEASQKGVKGAVVISAGFKEAGNKDLEDELIQVCKENNIALIGPNCLGVITPSISMNASFAKIMPKAGKVAFFSQSGALCTAVIDQALKLGIGFSKFVSMGNKAIIKEADVLNYLANDNETEVIAMYVEDLDKPKEIISAVKNLTVSTQKPVIILKSGKTKAGASASASHTGALAGDDSAYDALFKQAGIIRAENISELFDYTQAFSCNTLPKGNKVAIITNAGGPGVITTDEILSTGMELATLSENTETELKNNLPPAANSHNPIDVLGDAKADRYQFALDTVAKDNNVDSLIVILTPQSMTEVEKTAQAIIDIKNRYQKPVIASFMGDSSVKSGVLVLNQNNVAHIEYPDNAAKALSKLYIFQKNIENQGKSDLFNFNEIDTETIRNIIDNALASGKKSFPEAEANKILEAYGFPLLQSKVVKTKEEAKDFAKNLNKEVVIKIVSPDILHKSDVGGVVVGITANEIEEKFEEMLSKVKKNVPEAQIDGVLVMELAPKTGEQLILGSTMDPALGTMIMVGLGGIYVEILKDVSFGLIPLSKIDAKRMLNDLKTSQILDGARGQAELDKTALIETMGRLSKLLTDFPEIKELDINPLLVLPKGQGVYVLDSRIVLN
jgi:acetyl coenzyme A synthetase (ADP forming)-like protein